MPTTGISAQVEQAVYMASVFGLLLLLARPAYLVFSASEERGAQAVAQGVAGTVDALAPGSSVMVSLPAYPGLSLSVSISGTLVIASVDGTQANATVQWPMEPMVLDAGASYSFALADGHVLVSERR